MRLQHATWQEVEAYLQRSSGIILPIGSTEQHGPNGLIGTDAICPETIAWTLGERHEVLVGPTLNIGMAQHHLGFPGTISLRPATLLAVVRDTVESLACHGFTHVFFLNGHGGNIPTLQAAFAELRAERSFGCRIDGQGQGRRGAQGQQGTQETQGPQKKAGSRTVPDLALFNWFTGSRGRELARSLYGDSEGGHATPSEVSLSWCARPEAVKDVAMSPRVAPRGSANCDAQTFRRRFPDGRMGSDPSLASVEHGARFLEAGVEDALEAYRAFLQED